MSKKVFIGVGHGGRDPGAVANGIQEKVINLTTAIACRDVLERHNVTVLMSRIKDDSETLNEKINECNTFNPDVALDIHYNAGKGDGAEVYYYTTSPEGKSIANNILSTIVKIGQNSRGIKANTSFAFIMGTKAPAVLVECGFIDNKTDLALFDTEAEQKAMGEAIAKGILNYLGITYKEPVKAEVKKDYVLNLSELKSKGYERVIIEG